MPKLVVPLGPWIIQSSSLIHPLSIAYTHMHAQLNLQCVGPIASSPNLYKAKRKEREKKRRWKKSLAPAYTISHTPTHTHTRTQQ